MAGMMEFIVDTTFRQQAVVGFNNLVSNTRTRLSTLERDGRANYTRLSDSVRNVRQQQDRLNGSISGGTGIFGKLAGMAAAYLSVHTVISGIDLASDVAENSSKLDAVFQGMAKNARQSMADLSKELNMGEVTLAKDFANVGAVMKGLGFNDTTTLTNTENMLQAAYDAASFHNMTFEQSINAIRGAMLGESESLKAATGIIVQDSTMTEYASKLGYTWKNLNNTNKAQLRLNYTMDQLKKQGAVGDLKKTSDGFANVSRTITEMATDIKAKFFSAFMVTILPSLIKVRDYLITNKDAIAGYGETFANTFTGIASFVNEHKGLILGLVGVYVAFSTIMGVALAITTIKTAFDNTVYAISILKTTGALIKENIALGITAIQTYAVATAQKVMTGAQWLLNAAMSANPIALVIGALVLIGGAIYVAYQKSETFRNGVQAVWEWITNLWTEFRNSPIGGFIVEIAKLLTPIDEIWKAIQKVYGWWQDLKSAFSSGANVNVKTTTPSTSFGAVPGGSSYTPSFMAPYAGGSVKTSNVTNQTKNTTNITIPVNNNVNSSDLANYIGKQVKTGVNNYNNAQLKSIGGNL